MGKEQLLEKVEDNKKLVALKDIQPVAFLNSTDMQVSLDAIKSEVMAEINDVGTEEGRENINTLSVKIGKSLRFVEKAALDHARDLKAAPKIFDGKRKVFKDFMGKLQETVMAPLVKFDIERLRHEQILNDKVNALMINPCGVMVDEVSTLEGATAWRKQIIDTVIDDTYEDRQKNAEMTRDQSLLAVDGLIARYEREVKAELEEEQARVAQAEKDRIEYEARIAREATEKATLAANELIAKNNREIEQAKVAAHQEAQRAKVAAELAEEKRAAQEIIDKDNAVKDESARLKKIADDKELLEQIERKEAERKANTKKQRTAMYNGMMDVLALNGFDEDQSKLIIRLISDGKIPHIKIDYLNK